MARKLPPSTAKLLCDYNAERWKNIDKYLGRYFKTEDHKALHHLRVDIKKLVVIFHFIEYCGKGFDSADNLKPLSKVFKLSGKLRDHRNARLFCEKFAISKTIFHDQEAKQKGIRKKLESLYKKHKSRFRKLDSETQMRLEKLDAIQLRAYLQQVLHKTNSGLNENFSEEILHETRKKIKEVIYLSSLQDGKKRKVISGQKVQLLDRLQDLIGKWHDVVKFSAKIRNNSKNKSYSRVEEEKEKLLTGILDLAAKYTSKKPF